MATQSQAQAVKSLNKGAGRRRFVFKKFSQQIEDIELDVFRSLDPLKPEPSQGSSFFLECLVKWRELNTAEEFISLYEEMLPLVQTLPLIILQKDFIISKLLSRLDMKCRLSLEPILRLIAVLSRDLLEDFIPYLQRVANSMFSLLENGADREPEIIEQIFTSWSCIMMYLQKYLTRDVVDILKCTTRLRFYPKDYIREFMAESVSFLLRNAPFDRLEDGVREIMSEVVEKPLETTSGVSTLLFYVMKGFSSKLHSRAELVLQQVLDNDVICRGCQNAEGANPVVEVVTMTLQRLCEELQPAALNLMWKFLYDEISKCIANGYSVRLSHLLSLFISTIGIDNVQKMLDSKAVLELVLQLVQTFIMPSLMGKPEDRSCGIIDKTLQLMLCILDCLHGGNHLASLSSEVLVQWAPVFELRNTSFLNFVKELLVKDSSILRIFRTNIISSLADLLPTSEEEVIYLFHEFCEKLQPLSYCSFDDISKEGLSRIGSLLVKAINDEVHVDPSCKPFQSTNLARLWGVISCYSYVVEFQANPYVIKDLLEALDHFLKVDSESIAGFPRETWESLIGAALVSFNKLVSARVAEHDKLSDGRFLYFAKRYKSSFHVLSSVADFLDSVSRIQADGSHMKYRSELEAVKAADAFNIFSENLCHSDKRIRVSTLRILCHYERLDAERSNMITDDSHCDEHRSNVLQLLLHIETISGNIDTSRKVELWINKIQTGLSAGRISEAHLSLVMNAIIGILHNRFNRLWNPAMECIAVLIGKYPGIVWGRYVKYLEKCVSNCLSYYEHPESGNSELFESCDDLVRCFHKFISRSYDSTPLPTVLALLIKSSQKVSNVVESRSWQIIPLFLKFLGYEVEDLSSVKSYNSQASRGKEWKDVLEEWLNLVKLMHNPKSFYLSQFLKEVLQYRLLDENDPEVQLKVLDCLLNWKDEFLLPYAQHLKNLINTKNLRDELTRWNLSRESNLINEHHRASLVPLVIRILIPKVRKLKSLASRKVASVHHRKAVIAFIAGLDVDELPLFFALLIKPLQTVSPSGDAVDNLIWASPRTPDGFDSFVALRHFTLDNIKALPSKKIYGFLHVIEEILGVFDESRVNPFLDMLMGCVVCIMASCTPSMDCTRNSESFLVGSSSNLSVNAKDDGAEKEVMKSPGTKQYKDLRSLCLKIIALVLSKFENHDFDSEFWDMFFSSLKPLIDSFKQEGASSEKPSSLFLCFLAMSRSYKLVSLFQRVENLVPDIFSILAITTASEAIVSSVLKFIENLLSLDSELDSCDSDVKKILLPNVNTLVCSLHHFFTCKNATNRKSVRYLGGREANIFGLLPKHIEDPSIGRKFVDILLPSLTKKPRDSDACLKALHVIQDMAPMLGSEGTVKILNTISPLLISSTLEVRLGICDMLDALAGGDPSLLRVAKLLREFNATSALETGGLDYDTIIAAYEKIDNEFYGSVREDHALVILSQFVHDMSSKDLILRNSSYRVLLLFLEFSQKILKKEKESTDGRWSSSCILNVINNFFLKYIGDAMNKETSVQKVWMDLLREMVLRLPEVSDLKSYNVLCSEDAEQDFFNNIIHLQKHRRARALTRFCNIIGSCHLSEVITNKVLVPLLFNMLLEVNDGKGEHLRNASIQALSCISGCMEWKPYYALLNRCFCELKLKPDKQKLFLRLICSILDHYHFSGTNSGEESKGSSEKVSNPGMTLTKCAAVTTQSNDIQTCLHKNILPKIQKLITLDTDNVNVNVSLVAIKLLKLLPGNILETQLQSIIQRVSNFLKSRLESVRDEARSALAACLKELGLEYLQFVLKVLQGTLRRGFELHVLGYTLNFILSKCLPGAACGQLDYCLEELLSVAVNDIVGDVSEEKEVDKIAAKMKETRKKKSFETLKLIAENITFKSHVLKLISPVTDLLQKQQLTPKLKAKLETMLHHTASGIECNPTANDKHLFIFANRFIEKNIVEQNQGSEMVHAMKSSKQKKDDASGETSISGRLTCASPQCSHLIGVFAIGLLHSRMKKMKLKKNDEQLLSLLDPFIGLLSRCLNSKYEDVISSAIGCLSRLVRLPLPSLESQSDNIKGALFVILQGSASPSSPLTDPSIRLLTVLLRSTSIMLSLDQIHMLVQFPLFVDLERNPSDVALSLLKAIVKRKVVVSEIYNLAERVAELMVTSQLESIRKKCSQILMQFLLDYPLSKKAFQQHLDALLAYLWPGKYEHSTAREAVLEMLHAIIIKFPKQVVDDRSPTLFLLLLCSLVDDSDKKVRSMCGAAIKLLVERVSAQSLGAILDDCLIWYSGENQALWSAGAQALGLLVEVMKKGFHQKHIRRIFPFTSSILQSAVSYIKNSQGDPYSEPTPSLWKEAYYSLVMLEKILLQFPELCLAQDLEDIWETIIEFLLHPRIWLRNISSRLVALYFAKINEACREDRGTLIRDFFLMRPSRLFLVAVSLCSQLKVSLTDDAANNHLRQNIGFAVCQLYSMLGGDEDTQFFWSALEQNDEGHLLRAFVILDSRKGRSMFASLASGLNGQRDRGSCERLCYLLISSLLERMGKIALEMEEVQMRIVFDTFRLISPMILKERKVSEQFADDNGQSYAYQVLSPLYKICEGFTGKVIPDDVKQLAQEVRDSIRGTIGVQKFVQVYSLIQKNLKAKRDKRRQGEKLMAVVNPERNAKRKLRNAAKHREHKKRKIMTLKFGRLMQ